jgi:UDP:flavonoid glycosyltransferase YjiC (YdhE family)
VSEEFRFAARAGNPFGLFTLTMAEGTVSVGRDFGADLVVHTSDHAVGPLAALAMGVPALEVGNRISWSMRDPDFREGRDALKDGDVVRLVRAKLAIPEGRPTTVARIDPRAPSMGGLVADEADPRDGVPWWSMRYVPFNGGAAVPDWALRVPDRPRVCVTSGTGSGTTATPLHYAVPQLVLPAFADNPMSARRVADRGVGLTQDPASATPAVVRAMAERLLDEPSFAEAAREVSAEMATQPGPSAIVTRVSAAMS